MVQNSAVDAAIRGSTGTTRRRSFSHLLVLVTNSHKPSQTHEPWWYISASFRHEKATASLHQACSDEKLAIQSRAKL